MSDSDKPVVLLDLDNMMFDTRRFRHDLADLLQHDFGVTIETYWQNYTDYQIHTGDLHRYGFNEHIASLGLDVDAVERAIESELGKHDYLYDDVPAFLDFIAGQASFVSVLTHGEHRFQYLKYSLCPALQPIRFKDVLTHKREYIASRFAGEHGFLIDDHQVGELPHGFTHLWVSRCDDPGAYHSLTELQHAWPGLA